MGSFPTLVPMLSYEDCGAAAEWLCRAFGFEERERYAEPDGRVTHVELRRGDGVVFLGNPGPEYRSPKRHREECEAAARWSAVPYVIDGVWVGVQDVEAHFAAAKDAGATILSEVEDTPVGRHYRVEDPEGHRWMFSE
ncbi:MAG TPA: VOC family protein [Gaiellaceae bacterium]|nr:VOC family protein [Gaiellaceae bacterium]